MPAMVRPDPAGGKAPARRGPAAAAEPFLGPEGLATLLLSLLVLVLSGGLTLAAALWRVALVAHRAPTRPAAGDAARWLVVLGCRLEGDGPGAAFRARLDRARRLAAERPGLRVAVLGGATVLGAPAEGEAGLAYLRAAGLAPERLAAETRSRHTLENLREFRAGFLAEEGGGGGGTRPILLVTGRSHLARAVAMAEGLGLAATGCAAEEMGRHGLLPACELRRLPAEAFLLH